jgi:undecaprenyl-diphosphatase
MFEFLINIDYSLFFFINGCHSPIMDKVMFWISGKLTWIPFYLVLVFLLFKQFGKWAWLHLLAVLFLILAADQLSVHLFKNVFLRLRPCHNPEISSMVHLVNNKCGGMYGFVSSHAANSFAVAGLFSLLFKNKYLLIVLFFWAALVSYSRVYLGVHYPSDVFVGGLLGLFVSVLIYFLFSKIKCLWQKALKDAS